jgi:photosystem II stability/assembly factor-like uncharacterized protein
MSGHVASLGHALLPGARLAAAAAVLFAAGAAGAGTANAAAGPVAVWRPIGPQGGTVKSLAFAPDQAGTVYAGVLDYGVWKSTTAGRTWSQVSQGLPAGPIASLAVSPSDAGTVFAGTLSGLFKTRDGGTTWTPRGPPQAVLALAAAPADPRHLYEAVSTSQESSALYHSGDGGETWQPAARGVPSRFTVGALVADPHHAAVAVAAGLGFVPGTNAPISIVLATRDGGATWSTLTAAAAFFGVNALVSDRLSPGTLYAGNFYGIYRSDDGGARWRPLIADPRGIGVNALALDPARAGTIYAAAGNFSPVVLRSEDGGASWTQIASFSTQVNALAVDPQAPSRLLAGVELHAVARSRGGLSWRPARSGFDAVAVSAVAASPTTPGMLFSSPLASEGFFQQPLGVARSADGGGTWTYLPGPVAPNGGPLGKAVGLVFQLQFAPGDPSALLASTDSGLWASSDAGASWQANASLPMNELLDLAFCQANPRIALAAGWDASEPSISRAAASVDGAATWTELATLPSEGVFQAGWTVAAVVGGGCQLWLVGGYLSLSSAPFSALYRSSDGGSTWVKVGLGLPRGTGSGRGILQRLIPDPLRPLTVYAVLSGTPGLFVSDDAGLTWRQAGAPLAARGVVVSDLVVDPTGGSLYAATDHGVYASADRGSSWAPLGSGLTNPQVLRIALPASGASGAKTLIAATNGSGLFELSLAP